MKRKVRIYKDPNGQGSYVNKTAQWLRKAEDGIETGVTPVTAGIMQQMPQAQQQAQQQSQGDVMLQETTQMISRGMDKEDIKAQLLAKYANYEPDTAEYEDALAQVDQYLESVYDQLGETAREETSQRLELEDAEEYQSPEDVVAEEETNPNYYYDLAQEDSADSNMAEEYDFARYGGIPNKRSFVNKTIRQLRKAQKGDQVEEANTADVRGTENSPTSNSPGNINPFIAGVKGQAENNFYKQQAEQMYNNQFGQGMQQPQGNMDYAQLGGMRMRRANRKMFGTPFTPPGVTSSKYSFGPLGGVRSAEVQFNPLMMASMFPMMSFPGMGGFSSYGYQTPKKKYTTGRLVTEKIATNVNNKSTEDVAKATGSDAAKSSEKFDVVVGNPEKKVEFKPREGEIIPAMNSRSIANTFSQPHPELALQQRGGFVFNPGQDQFGNLQKFIYGGDEMDQMFLQDLFQPPINQSDLDYTDSKDTTDPYFKHGGLYHFDGEEDSETDATNAGKTYSQEEFDKMLAEKQKTWETDYQTKAKQQQQQQMQQMQQMQQYQAMQQYMNPRGYGMSGYGYRGAPMGGFGGPGLLGAAGRLAGSFIGGRQSQYSPVGNPLQYAATAAGITKAGMLPTGMKYSKEKKQDGNFFERKLGFNKDKIWTIDYATPEQIKAGVKPGTTPAVAPGMAGSQPGKANTSLKDKAMNLRERFLNRNTPAEADAEAFTATLTGSSEPQGPSKSAEQELKRFQDSQKARGLVFDEKVQKWVKAETPNTSVMNTPNGMTSSQGADIVTGTPGTAVNLSNTQPSSSGMQSAGMAGKSAEEIKRAYQAGTSIPTVVNKGNTTIVNAAGEPVDASQYAYGGYVPDYMAYGGYIPQADLGINFSSVSNSGNPVVGAADSPIWGAMDYFSQNKNIQNPDADKFKNYTIEPENLEECTDEQKLDPTSKCYEPQTAQLKIKEEKGSGAQKAANILGSTLDAGALLADDMNYFTENRTKYVPGMTEFARGEKQAASEDVKRGSWNALTGKEGDPQSFRGVISKKGGSIGKKKSSASGHKINISEFQDLLKLAGLK